MWESGGVKVIKEGAARSAADAAQIRAAVSEIIAEVRSRGDQAVREYTRRFDGPADGAFRVEREEAEESLRALCAPERKALEAALDNIRAFAAAQRSCLRELPAFSPVPGVTLGHRLLPVERALCYVPGGAYPLFSTALMLITPAKAAGVSRIIACSPPVKGTTRIHPATLAAMALAGADEIYAVGGAQAIAAFAYGTDEIPRVDLITGPGNAYVAEAKRQCCGQVGIDFIAGPSEVLIIADRDARPALLAADLLAQCEHDALAQAILVSTDSAVAEKTREEVERQLHEISTSEKAARSWADYGAIYLARTLDEAVDFANERASEHLELHIKNTEEVIPRLHNYGALFVGENAAEVFGDYAAGTNHALPTNGASRWTGGVWVGTFLKTLTFQSADAAGAAALSPIVSLLAQTEGLDAHRRAAAARGCQ
jgi:histidinol dehydrogenase